MESSYSGGSNALQSTIDSSAPRHVINIVIKRMLVSFLGCLRVVFSFKMGGYKFVAVVFHETGTSIVPAIQDSSSLFHF